MWQKFLEYNENIRLEQIKNQKEQLEEANDDEVERGGSSNSNVTLIKVGAQDRSNLPALLSENTPTQTVMRPDETVMTMPLASREYTDSYPIEETIGALRQMNDERDIIAQDFSLPQDK